MGLFSSEAADTAVPDEYKSFWKSRNTEMGDMIKGMALEDYKAAAKGPSEADIRKATATGAAQAGAVSQAGAMEAAQGLMGAGTGAVSPGRAQALMAQSQAAAQEGTAQAGKGARETLEMVAQRKKESAMATFQHQQQFDRQMAQQTIDNIMGGMETGAKIAEAAAVIAASGAFSDIRLKEDIVRTGESPSGIPMYEFNYIGDSARYSGTMAQDLLETHPHAVTIASNGYYAVYYDQIDVPFEMVAE